MGRKFLEFFFLIQVIYNGLHKWYETTNNGLLYRVYLNPLNIAGWRSTQDFYIKIIFYYIKYMCKKISLYHINAHKDTLFCYGAGTNIIFLSFC